MDLKNFTTLAQEALQEASTLAIKYDASEMTPFHLVESLIKQHNSPVKSVIKTLFEQNHTDYITFVHALTEYNTNQPKIQGSSDFAISRNLQVILVKSDNIKEELHAPLVSCEHLLIALIRYDHQIASFLKEYGITDKNIINVIKDTSQQSSSNETSDRSELLQALWEYAIDITAQAEHGKMDPIIGRDEEIRRTMQILSRRTKNNPVLVGDPGVGKTALVEWLAQRIIKGEVPDTLQDKKIFELRISDLMSGTEYRGAFEKKISKILELIDQLNGEVILFIDELHTIVGAGKTEGSSDLWNILKPALARGRLRVIGATTLNEYRKYIEKDAALERRFQPVIVDEPQRDDAVSILRGIKENYERYHGVKIADSAIVSAVDLSIKYINDRFLPDKAIDLMDEATAAVKMNLISLPPEITDLERKIRNLEVEKEAISIEFKDKKDEKKQHRLTHIESELASLKEQHQALKYEWDQERSLLIKEKELKDQIVQIEHQAQLAEKQTDYNKVAELRYGQLPTLQSQLQELESRIQQERANGQLHVNDIVTPEDIAQVISRWTGIPASKLVEKDIDKLNHIEEWLNNKVIGQSSAVSSVSSAIRRSRAWLQDPHRPIGSFIFAGPTGVGKTELAKSLADYLFNDPHAMIRIDMSEYMEKHAVSRLIGSPPGYIWHDEGGQLTEAVRRKPYSVILFDEIEKAHPDVFHVFLQILDDGRLTDSKGRTVNFKNTIIIMTTNLGSQTIMDKLANYDTIQPEEYQQRKEELNEILMTEYKSHFRPEFLNRIDDIIIFDPISQVSLRAIVDVQLKTIITLLKKEKDIDLNITDQAKDELGTLWYDPVFGARPLKRVIQKYILDLLAWAIINGEITDWEHITIDYNHKRFQISSQKKT